MTTRLAEHLYQNGLTPRQIDVVGLMLCGLRHNEIADTLSIAPKTVKYHATMIYRCLHVKCKTDLIFKLSDFMVLEKPLTVQFNNDIQVVDVVIVPDEVLPAGVNFGQFEKEKLGNVHNRA